MYKPLPAIPEFPFSPDKVNAEPISLAKLQELAYANSPKLQAAIARVEQARGQAIQVGLYPNPEAGYESDTVGTNASAGYHGVFANQTIVTADKLKLSRSVELQEVVKSEYALATGANRSRHRRPNELFYRPHRAGAVEVHPRTGGFVPADLRGANRSGGGRGVGSLRAATNSRVRRRSPKRRDPRGQRFRGFLAAVGGGAQSARLPAADVGRLSRNARSRTSATIRPFRSCSPGTRICPSPRPRSPKARST